MKRLVSGIHDNDIRDFVMPTTPVYPSFPDQHDDTFKSTDEKSYSRMMNKPVVERLIQKEKEKQVENMNNTRLKRVAMMPINMFQSQLDQISDKGRDVLKAIEDYKFFVDQASRVMKNDPALTEMIQGKKKNLEQSAQQIYDVVFDIENMDINSIYQRQQEVTQENQESQQNDDQNKQPDQNKQDDQLPQGKESLEDKIDNSKPSIDNNKNVEQPAPPSHNAPPQQEQPKPPQLNR